VRVCVCVCVCVCKRIFAEKILQYINIIWSIYCVSDPTLGSMLMRA
jgi:hypothetical protein